MKKMILLLMNAGFALFLSAQPVYYEITAKIQGAEGETFILQKLVGGKPANIDSAVSRNGVFKMNAGAVEYPEMVNLSVRKKSQNVTFFLENGKISIEGKLDSLNRSKITGSKTQDEFYDFQKSLQDVNERRIKLISEYQTASQAIVKEIKTIQTGFIKDHPGSYAVPQLLRAIMNELPRGEIDSIVMAMDPAVAATPMMQEIILKNDMGRSVAIGKKAPDFTLNDVKGIPVSLSSLKGYKLLLIDFWAAWCKPCRAENPNVVRIYKEFGRKGYNILGVSLDRNKADWVKAIADDKLTWKQVSDLQYFNGPVTKQYNVISIPANFLLDANGTIIAKNLRGEELYNKVKSVLNAE